ncbi:MAG: DUF6701 domain-containing protein, partial [Pseudomonadota bacterium]|nr:DUF6701 domain-containing protein [Pseudomonadota bacterium]
AVAWDQMDAWQLDVNGILQPVAGADLSDNATTPNYGNENGVDNGEDAIEITARLGAAMDENAVLENDDFTGGDLFTDFANGIAAVPHNLRFDEVGIIDLVATLESGDYLDGGESVTSELLNVGRFYPANFRVTAPMLTPRPLFAPNTGGPFTYMGEQFSVMFTLTAYNAQGQSAANVTKNYFGDFAKLTSVAASVAPEASPPSGQLGFYAVENGGSASDVSHTTRLSAVLAGGPNPFDTDYQSEWDSGSVTLDGNLVLARRTDQTPDGPFGPVQIAVRVRDTDGVVDSGRTVTEDIDACNPDCAMDPKHAASANLIGTHEFRYGRIRLENAYGSEIADLDAGNAPIGRDVLVRLVAEYFDGTDFVSNTDDNATTYDSVALDVVPGSYTDDLDALEAAVTSMVTPGIVYRGETMETQGQNDVPMYLRAPGEGNAGTAVLELDLGDLGLDFLTFDWRDAGELEDVKELDGGNPADDDQDFPRALIEFGTFRGNDRIINWQELFE